MTFNQSQAIEDAKSLAGCGIYKVAAVLLRYKAQGIEEAARDPDDLFDTRNRLRNEADELEIL